MSPEELWIQYTTEEQRQFFDSLPFDRLSDEMESMLQKYLTTILSQIPYSEFIVICDCAPQNPIIDYLCQNFLGQIEYSVDGYGNVDHYKYNALTYGLKEILELSDSKTLNLSDLEPFYAHITTSRCKYPFPINWRRSHSYNKFSGPKGPPGLKGPKGTCRPPNYIHPRLEEMH